MNTGPPKHPLSGLQRRLVQVFSAKVSAFTFDDPHLAAKFFPYQSRLSSYVVPRSAPSDAIESSALPVPPSRLWLGYAKTPEQYLAGGERRVKAMQQVLQATAFNLTAGNRVLDFGCASGIMLRWLLEIARTGEAWGVDISGDAIVWCQQHLSPPFKFATTTSFPHLPFEDQYFDLIYAASVFTHIADLAEAWLLELKRILRPGGRLFITVHDNEAITLILNENREPRLYDRLRAFESETHLQTTGFSLFSIDRSPGPGAPGQAQVFYDREYLVRHWGNYLQVLTTVPRVWGRLQTAVVLTR